MRVPNERMLLDTFAISRLNIGKARVKPLYSSLITCTACSFLPLNFCKMIKSVAIRCTKAVVGSRAPLSSQGLGRNLLTFLRYILDRLQIGHAGFLGKCHSLCLMDSASAANLLIRSIGSSPSLSASDDCPPSTSCGAKAGGGSLQGRPLLFHHLQLLRHMHGVTHLLTQ